VKLGCVAAAALSIAVSQAMGQEIVLQNDSLEDGDEGAIQLGFVGGEIGAATFHPDEELFPLWIKRVQILWFSFFGEAPDILQDAILIYDGDLPDPGGVEFEALGPVLTDGFLNEFDISSFNLVFNQPSPITAGLAFSEDGAPNGNIFSPSLVTDTDGCQPGLNPIFALPGGWKDLCSFGASGDLVIRLVVEPVGCSADVNDDGELNIFDFIAFQQLFTSNDPAADCDNDGTLTVFDFICFQDVFIEGC